ncbi:HPP family protein [Halosegnis marinus]|uniref:HPP family protein n=1 Tax=Halosegnis marinus TaxID=3034023 RepID=A0ABD5ZLR5_9EURY
MPGLRDRWRAALARVRRVERRELAEFRAWLETTRNLVHLTGLVAVPVLVAAVTAVSNAVALLPFVLFPPIASGTFTLFSDPEGRYADPRTFVGGLTTGALCGAAAEMTAVATGLVAPTAGVLDRVSPLAAGLAVLLTGAATWALAVEEPAAFSTALLALVVPTTGSGYLESLGLYVLFTALASVAVASAFVLWRDNVYERRADILYRSTEGGRRVLVPMRDAADGATALLAGALAAAGGTGTVVLLDTVETAALATAERELLAGEASSARAAPAPDADDDRAERRVAAPSAARMEGVAARVEARTDATCEVVVASGDSPAGVALRAARETNCDLIAARYESADGAVTPFVAELFRGDTDVLAHRSTDREAWPTVLVPVRRASDVAHAMLEFAVRLAEPGGRHGRHLYRAERRPAARRVDARRPRGDVSGGAWRRASPGWR